MNSCCKEKLQKLQNKLHSNASELIKIAGKRETVMEEAAYRHAEILAEVMGIIKEFALEENNK